MSINAKREMAKRMSALAKLCPGIKTTDYVLVAGGALAVLGLRDKFDDIDITVNAETFEKLQRLGNKPVKNHPSGVPVIQILPIDADIHLDPPAMEKPTMVVELPGHVLVTIMSPEALLEQKIFLSTMPGRTKEKQERDMVDINALREYIEQHGPTKNVH